MAQVFNKKFFIITLVGLLLVMFIYIVFDNLVFRLKSADPPFDRVATSSTSITLEFSQPLESFGEITINNEQINETTISDKSIVIPLSTFDLQDGTLYTLKINDIKSKWFKNSIKTITYELNAVYTDFSDLSNEQQKSQINSSSSNQLNDPFFNNIFPIVEEKYQIEVDKSETDEIGFISVIFFDEIPDYDNNGKITPLSNEDAEKYRIEALNTIREYGGIPDKYYITYSNTYLNDKYNSREDYHD